MNTSRRPKRALIGALIAAATLAPALVAQPASAIVGGQKAATTAGYIGSFQRIDSPREDHHVCGATLIASRWAIIAGHCTNWVDGTINLEGTGKVSAALSGEPVGWRVRFGSRDTRSGGQRVTVKRFVRIGTSVDPGIDIALLQFAGPVKATPASIATRAPKPGAPAHMVGWGHTNKGGLRDYDRLRSYPRALREARTEIATNKTCGIDPKRRALCVGVPGAKVGPENMDSGGPVLVPEAGRRAVIAGTVNGGNYVGGLHPAIYTDLSAHRRWIRSYVSGQRRIPAPPAVRTQGLSGTATIDFHGCSASVVRVPSSQPSDPALLLTNGHCLTPRPAPGKTLLDRPAKKLVRFNDARGNGVRRGSTAQLLYATMTGTDVALYRLTESYADLAASGLRIFTLATTAPAVGTPLSMLAAELQATYSCRVAAIVPTLREAGYEQRNAIRYANARSCQPIGGSSGSPMVDHRTGEVVAIHNTHVNGDAKPCKEGEPCEVAPGGTTTAIKGRGYAQQTAGLAACIVAGSRLDLAVPGCELTGAAVRSAL